MSSQQGRTSRRSSLSDRQHQGLADQETNSKNVNVKRASGGREAAVAADTDSLSKSFSKLKTTDDRQVDGDAYSRTHSRGKRSFGQSGSDHGKKDSTLDVQAAGNMKADSDNLVPVRDGVLAKFPTIKSIGFFTVSHPVSSDFKTYQYRPIFDAEKYKKVGIYAFMNPNPQRQLIGVSKEIEQLLYLKFSPLAKTPLPQIVQCDRKIVILEGSFEIEFAEICENGINGHVIPIGPKINLGSRVENNTTFRDGLVLKKGDIYSISNNSNSPSYALVLILRNDNDTSIEMILKSDEFSIDNIRVASTTTERSEGVSIGDVDEDDDDVSTESLNSSSGDGCPFNDAIITNMAKELALAISITQYRLTYTAMKDYKKMRTASAAIPLQLMQHYRSVKGSVVSIEGKATSPSFTSTHNMILVHMGGFAVVHIRRNRGNSTETMSLTAHASVSLRPGDAYTVTNKTTTNCRFYSLCYGN